MGVAADVPGTVQSTCSYPWAPPLTYDTETLCAPAASPTEVVSGPEDSSGLVGAGSGLPSIAIVIDDEESVRMEKVYAPEVGAVSVPVHRTPKLEDGKPGT